MGKIKKLKVASPLHNVYTKRDMKNNLGKPTRILKQTKDVKSQTNLKMKILLTNKTPKSSVKVSSKACRINTSDRSKTTFIKKHAQVHDTKKSPHRVDPVQKKKDTRRVENVGRKNNQTNKENTMKPTRREQLEIWRAQKGLTKKENCHPLLSRKRALSKVVHSPSFKQSEQKIIPSKSQRRHTLVPSFKEPDIKTPEKKNRRKTMSSICQKESSSNKCTFYSPITERTPWKNKDLGIRQRLDMWLESKGKTPTATPRSNKNNRQYTKSPHPVHNKNVIKEMSPRTPEDLNTTFTIEEETEDNVNPDILINESNIVDKLNELMEKLKQEVNTEEVQSDLDELLHHTQNVVRHADYWICRARIAAKQNDVQRVVCLLEQAYTFDAKPEEKIKEEICSFLENIEAGDTNDATAEDKDFFFKYAITPGRRVHFAVDTMSPLQFKSSIIRFCIVESKTFKKRLNAQIKRKIMTPVRRSTRLQKSDLPSFLKSNHRMILSPSEVENEIIDGEISFRPNKTINTPLNNGWIINDEINKDEIANDPLELSFM